MIQEGTRTPLMVDIYTMDLLKLLCMSTCARQRQTWSIVVREKH